MHLIKHESKEHYLQSIGCNKASASLDQVIIVEEIKMNLISKSCLALGIIPFLSNLISSSGDGDENEQPDVMGKHQEDWMADYIDGMGHEIYRCHLSSKFENKYFSEVAREIYQKVEAIVFALEVKCGSEPVIRLNPSDFVVNNIEQNQIYVYCIAPDPKAVEQI